jgi:hypothetical protein
MTHATKEPARKNRIVLVLGRKESGKSTYLRTFWTRHEPRLITLDYTGESATIYPDAIPAYSFTECAELLARFIRNDVREWHIVAGMPEPDVAALYGLLVPIDPRVPSMARALGGVAIECDEVSFVAPLDMPKSSPIVRAALIGRHHALSQFYATQRPVSVSRMVSSQADVITSLRMHEPRDRRFLRDTVGVAFSEAVYELPPHHHAEYVTASGLVTIRDANGKTVRALDIAELQRERERGTHTGQGSLGLD